MFNPVAGTAQNPTPPSVADWVPLEEFDWYWSGTATLPNGGNWQVTAPVYPPPGPIGGVSTATEPGWIDDFVTWRVDQGL
jgi:hypothetical protein